MGEDIMTRRVVIFPFKVGQDLSKRSIQEIIGYLSNEGISVLIDLDSIYNELHLASAIMHAARSINDREARARDPSLEVLRWISGSHQVSEGISIAGPGEGTERILLAILPSDWPLDTDTLGLPEIHEAKCLWDHPPYLIPMDTPVNYGKELAIERLGLERILFSGEQEMEKAVLEAICLPGLK